VVRQLFEPALADPARRATLLAGAAASAAGVFDTAADAAHKGADGSFSVLHGLYWLTVNLAADGPLLLAIDDVQWCDNGSLRFFAYLLRRLEGLPLLLVATLRTGERHDVESLLAELVDDLATVPLRPQPLDFEAVADLVRERLGDPADDSFVAACHRTTPARSNRTDLASVTFSQGRAGRRGWTRTGSCAVHDREGDPA
jgi:hypothetical protein